MNTRAAKILLKKLEDARNINKNQLGSWVGGVAIDPLPGSDCLNVYTCILIYIHIFTYIYIHVTYIYTYYIIIIIIITIFVFSNLYIYIYLFIHEYMCSVHSK